MIMIRAIKISMMVCLSGLNAPCWRGLMPCRSAQYSRSARQRAAKSRRAINVSVCKGMTIDSQPRPCVGSIRRHMGSSDYSTAPTGPPNRRRPLSTCRHHRAADPDAGAAVRLASNRKSAWCPLSVVRLWWCSWRRNRRHTAMPPGARGLHTNSRPAPEQATGRNAGRPFQ
jgi:hypothetical protein